MSILRPALLSTLLLAALPVRAHELWIEPLAYAVAPDDALQARLVNGQNFGAVDSPGLNIRYFPGQIARLEVWAGDAMAPVTGRIGDNPAITAPPLAEGLQVLGYQSGGDIVRYEGLAKFLTFAGHKDLAASLGADVAAAHAANGFPETGIQEHYIRYSKALVAVGNGAGADRNLGFETEIIAGANPHLDDLSGGMPVTLLYKGLPRADAQVELFDKAPDGTATLTLHRTDAAGRAVLPVVPGHSYLVSAVVLRLPEGEVPAGPVWQTLWAALTFQVPDPAP